MENEMIRRAQLYGVIKKLASVSDGDPLKDALDLAFGSPDGADVISGARRTVTVNEDWLRACEEVLPHFDEAIRQSRSLIKKDGEVVRIDRAKRPSKDSVTHLCRHSYLIKNITKEGRLLPEEIYITENDEDYAVYENRFLYLALSYASSFVKEKYDAVTAAVRESGVRMRVDRSSTRGDRSVSYRLELSETCNGGENAADLALQLTLKRIRAVMNTLSADLSLPLMKKAASAPRLQPPVVRTNIIKNNVHFAGIYDFYTFLCSYAGPGFTTRNDAAEGTALSARSSDALKYVAALQFFIAYQSAFDGWEDSAALYDESEDEKRKESIRQKRRDAEAAREAMARGGMTADEYIAVLESAAADLTREYERAGEENSSLRKKEREQADKIIKLTAERDMTIDKMRKAAEEAEIRIAQNSARIGTQYAEEAKRRTEREKEALDKERLSWQKEKDLLEARLRACALIKGEDESDVDINGREDFIELERQYAALKKYYKEQWARAKKRIRAEEFRNRKSQDGEEKS
ncbi:MAG: hypothetical protein J5879_00330 [Clostridia bacterium]|nr:hypothetical protein [Clostridia bacterium]